LIFENLEKASIENREKVKRKDFLDRTTRLNAIKQMTDAISSLQKVISKYVTVKDFRSVLEHEKLEPTMPII